jgi:hypothetical protein
MDALKTALRTKEALMDSRAHRKTQPMVVQQVRVCLCISRGRREGGGLVVGAHTRRPFLSGGWPRAGCVTAGRVTAVGDKLPACWWAVGSHRHTRGVRLAALALTVARARGGVVADGVGCGRSVGGRLHFRDAPQGDQRGD